MRLIVLSRNASLYSTARFARAARARNHDVDVVDPLDLQIGVATSPTGLLYRGRPLPPYDVLLPRIGASVLGFGLSVVRTFEQSGTISLNGADAIALSRDKIASLDRLSGRGLPVPDTISLRCPDGVAEAAALVGGYPVVVKLQRGTQGVGTMLAESKKTLIPLADTLFAMGHEVLLQRFVRQSRGRDVRALVVGGRVVAAMRRTARRGEFRANIHRGGRGEPVTLDSGESRCAVRAAKALALDIAGVDLLQTDEGPMVLEVNSSPGLEGIEQITEIDVAGAVIALAARALGAKKRRAKRGR